VARADERRSEKGVRDGFTQRERERERRKKESVHCGENCEDIVPAKDN